MIRLLIFIFLLSISYTCQLRAAEQQTFHLDDLLGMEIKGNHGIPKKYFLDAILVNERITHVRAPSKDALAKVLDENFRTWLKSIGYNEINLNVTYNSDGIVVDAQVGKQYVLKKIEISGDSPVDKELIRKVLTNEVDRSSGLPLTGNVLIESGSSPLRPLWTIGKPADLNDKALRKTEVYVDNLFWFNGYKGAQIICSSVFNDKDGSITLDIQVVNKGQVQKLEGIEIKGLNEDQAKLCKQWLYKACEISEDTLFTNELIIKLYKTCYNSGRFLKVTNKTDPSQKDNIIRLDLVSHEGLPQFGQDPIPGLQRLLNANLALLKGFKSGEKQIRTSLGVPQLKLKVEILAAIHGLQVKWYQEESKFSGTVCASNDEFVIYFSENLIGVWDISQHNLQFKSELITEPSDKGLDGANSFVLNASFGSAQKKQSINWVFKIDPSSWTTLMARKKVKLGSEKNEYEITGEGKLFINDNDEFTRLKAVEKKVDIEVTLEEKKESDWIDRFESAGLRTHVTARALENIGSALQMMEQNSEEEVTDFIRWCSIILRSGAVKFMFEALQDNKGDGPDIKSNPYGDFTDLQSRSLLDLIKVFSSQFLIATYQDYDANFWPGIYVRAIHSYMLRRGDWFGTYINKLTRVHLGPVACLATIKTLSAGPQSPQIKKFCEQLARHGLNSLTEERFVYDMSVLLPDSLAAKFFTGLKRSEIDAHQVPTSHKVFVDQFLVRCRAWDGKDPIEVHGMRTALFKYVWKNGAKEFLNEQLKESVLLP